MPHHHDRHYGTARSLRLVGCLDLLTFFDIHTYMATLTNQHELNRYSQWAQQSPTLRLTDTSTHTITHHASSSSLLLFHAIRTHHTSFNHLAQTLFYVTAERMTDTHYLVWPLLAACWTSKRLTMRSPIQSISLLKSGNDVFG